MPDWSYLITSGFICPVIYSAAVNYAGIVIDAGFRSASNSQQMETEFHQKVDHSVEEFF